MFDFETIQSIAIPKGENRDIAEQWLRDNGLNLPDIPARCLHDEGKRDCPAVCS